MSISGKASFARQVGARIVGSTLQAVTFYLLATNLGPASFGIFGAILAIGAYGSRIFNLGMPTRALRLGSEHLMHRRAGALLLAHVLLVGPLFVLVALVAQVIPGFAWGLCLMACALVGLDYITELIVGISVGRGFLRRAEIVLVVRRLFPLAGYLGGATYELNAWGLGLGCLSAVAVSLLVCLPTVERPSNLLEEAVASRDYWLSSLLAGINGLDLFILSILGSVQIAGWYAAGVRLLAPLGLLTTSAVSLLTPKLAEAPPGQRLAVFKRVLRMSVVFAVGAAVLAYPFSRLAVLALGEAYDGAAALFGAFIIAAGIAAVAEIYAAFLFSINQARVLTRVRLLSSPMHLGILTAASVLGAGYLAVAVIFASLVHVFLLQLLTGKLLR